MYTVYPKKYAHGFCFAVLCCGYALTDYPISIRLTSLALWQSSDCPSASKATLMNTSCEFIMNDCITTTKQSTTKPCAFFLGYTVHASVNVIINGSGWIMVGRPWFKSALIYKCSQLNPRKFNEIRFKLRALSFLWTLIWKCDCKLRPCYSTGHSNASSSPGLECDVIYRQSEYRTSHTHTTQSTPIPSLRGVRSSY